ncbi:Tc toxin subunit A-related protein [Pseudomonas sp. S1_E04]
MPTSIDSQLNETLRDALVGYYLDEVVPNASEFVSTGLHTRIKTANDLYEYKLLDVQVSQAVATSPVASAIASVQQYINAALMGMEPGYETKVMEDHLITQWRDINSQYPIWAANQQLRYYPEVYIDPSLRLSKSSYFQQLENDLNQNKIHIDTTQEAVLAYLASFEEVANLTIINGYISTDDFRNGMYYFIGKSRAESVYYWRSVDMSQRTYKDLNSPNPDRPKFDYPQPGAWSDWHKANLPISASAIERTIRPVLFNNRLFIFWVECIDSSPDALTVEHSQAPAPGTPVTTVKSNPMLRLNLVYKKYDDSWSVPQTIIEAWSEAPQFKTEDLDKWVESIAVHDGSSTPDSMFVAMYGGYVAGSSLDGSQDQYAFLKTALIDKNFNVTPLFPKRGYVPSIGTASDIKAPQVLRLGRLFAHDNKGRFQFRMTGYTIGLKDVVTTSPHSDKQSWNYGGLQSCVAEPVKGVDINYDPVRKGLACNFKLGSTASLVQVIEFAAGRGYQGSGYIFFKFVLPFDLSGSDYVTFLAGSTAQFVGLPSISEMTANRYFHFSLRHQHNNYDDPEGRDFVRDSPQDTKCTLNVIGESVISISGKVMPVVAVKNFRSGVGLSSMRVTEFNSSGMYLRQIIYTPITTSVVPVSGLSVRRVLSPGNMYDFQPIKYSDMVTLTSGGSLVPEHAPPSSLTLFLPIDSETLLPDWAVSWPAGLKKIPLIHGLRVFENFSVAGQATKLTTVELELRPVSVNPLIAPRINTRASPTLGVAEFIDFAGSDIRYTDGSTTVARQPIRMNTLFARELINRANIALENLLSWETQGLEEPPLTPPAATNLMDFHGANGKYFWELFLHLPFMVSHRLNLEQQFDGAEQWLGFIFDPARKRDSSGRPDYWNVRPLMADPVEMDYVSRAPDDPDGIASSHPVRYRKAVYLHYLKNLLDRGDMAYRQLTPDSLGEAKLWYVRVLDLLGPRPDIKLVDHWTPMTLQALSNSTNLELRAFEQKLIAQDLPRDDAVEGDEDLALPIFTGPGLYLRTFTPDTTLSDLDNGHLRLPINRHLVQTWDIAESRLANLRNHRTLDGKPLSLPLFAAPLNPKDLLAAFGQGASAGGAGRLLAQEVPHYRFQVMHSRAMSAVDTLIQFGNTLLSLIERKERAQFEEMQAQQGWELAQFAIDLQKQAQKVDLEQKNALLASRAMAEGRQAYYRRLADEVVSAEEVSAASLHMVGRVAEGVGALADIVAAAVIIPPNAIGGGGGGVGGVCPGIPPVPSAGAFGFASAGGWRLEGLPQMAVAAAAGAATMSHGAAEALDRVELLRRRHEEWRRARDQATLEIEQIDAQLLRHEAQSQATALHIKQAEQRRDQAVASYAFLGKRFSNAQLYQWLNGQFSTFYYQAYDAALALCLAAEACWQFEIADYSRRFIRAGVWNDSYRGLGAGEALKLQLLQMGSAYLSRNERRLEITKTVSLKRLKTLDPDVNKDWEAILADLSSRGAVEFELSAKMFDDDFPRHFLRRIRRVGVTLPVVLGPYENVCATLSQTWSAVQMGVGLKENLRAGQQIALSSGVDDDGRFTGGDDGRYAAFEGTGAISRWELRFTEQDSTWRNRQIASLSDIIVHVNYTAKAGQE